MPLKPCNIFTFNYFIVYICLALFLPDSGMHFLKWTLVFFFLLSNCYAQSDLRSFTAEQIDSTVNLHWTFEKGFVCTGTTIERSENKIEFYKIGQIEGICGSFDEPIEFDFADSNPLPNRINYYRLKLGSNGYSSTIAVLYVLFNENQYSLAPNPISNESTLFFKNRRNDNYILKIFDQNGHLIQKQEGFSQSFSIQKKDFPQGVYLFSLCDENADCISGRFIVL